VNIHSPKTGKNINMNGKIRIERDINYSPRPSILVELPCNRILLTVYLEKMFIRPKGTSTGIPTQKKAVIKIIKYIAAASL
jgi:hypothetical protein